MEITLSGTPEELAVLLKQLTNIKSDTTNNIVKIECEPYTPCKPYDGSILLTSD